MSIIRTYSELMTIPTFIERVRYLKLNGRVGEETFGYERWLNQKFYRTYEWKRVRDYVISRDLGCDLADEGYPIVGRAIIHHLNPIRTNDIVERTDILLNPEYLITTTHATHEAIHYGDENLLITSPNIRTPNDTCPWKRS